jgi:transposase
MARTKTWEISDEFWKLVEPLIPKPSRDPDVAYKRKSGGGRKAKYSNRVFFAAIVYVLRTGIIWNALPRETFEGVSSAMVHRKFQQWATAGFFTKLWERGLAEYDEAEGIAWLWQSADGAMIEAPLAQESVGPNPTDRGKKWDQAKHPRRRPWRPLVTRRHRCQSAR